MPQPPAAGGGIASQRAVNASNLPASALDARKRESKATDVQLSLDPALAGMTDGMVGADEVLLE
jgi:hypothetical protein